MKDFYLFILQERISEYSDLFDRIKEISPYNVELIPFQKLISEDFRDFFKKRNIASIAVAGEANFLDSVYDRLNGYFNSIYNVKFNNTIHIYFNADFFYQKEAGIWKTNGFLLSNEPHKFTQQAINFNLYILKFFNELTASSRLSNYIVDSFKDIVNTEILKAQKNEIEKLNKELDDKNARLMNELEMAQRVQMSLIPSYEFLQRIKELDFGFNYSPMERIGGDFFDIIRVGRNRYGFLIADVSGHGVPAALITTMAKIFFNSHTEWTIKPGEVCMRVHKEINEFVGDLYYYLTAFYGIIDLETSEFQYTNAGHQPAIIYHSKTSTVDLLPSNATLIGILDEPEYQTDSIFLERGDKLLLFTDGIIEAKNENGELYDLKRVVNLLKEKYSLPTRKFVDILMKDVENFCGILPSEDDKAILMVSLNNTVTPIQ